MTLSLKERLAERLESQSAEIEAMTAAELKKLAVAAQRHATNELERMRSDIHDLSEELSATLRQLSWLKNIVAATWGGLIVSLMVAGLLVWQSKQAQPPFMVFPMAVSNDTGYAILPEGSQPITCTLNGKRVPCVEIPRVSRN